MEDAVTRQLGLLAAAVAEETEAAAAVARGEVAVALAAAAAVAVEVAPMRRTSGRVFLHLRPLRWPLGTSSKTTRARGRRRRSWPVAMVRRDPRLAPPGWWRSAWRMQSSPRRGVFRAGVLFVKYANIRFILGIVACCCCLSFV